MAKLQVRPLVVPVAVGSVPLTVLAVCGRFVVAHGVGALLRMGHWLCPGCLGRAAKPRIASWHTAVKGWVVHGTGDGLQNPLCSPSNRPARHDKVGFADRLGALPGDVMPGCDQGR